MIVDRPMIHARILWLSKGISNLVRHTKTELLCRVAAKRCSFSIIQDSRSYPLAGWAHDEACLVFNFFFGVSKHALNYFMPIMEIVWTLYQFARVTSFSARNWLMIQWSVDSPESSPVDTVLCLSCFFGIKEQCCLNLQSHHDMEVEKRGVSR